MVVGSIPTQEFFSSFCFVRRRVTMQSAALSSASQNTMPPVAEIGEQSIITLNSLCVSCYIRDISRHYKKNNKLFPLLIFFNFLYHELLQNYLYNFKMSSTPDTILEDLEAFHEFLWHYT